MDLWHAMPNIEKKIEPLVSGTCEPTNYAQAAFDPHWQLAMKAELDALKLNRTWTLVPLPPGHKSIDCKWMPPLNKVYDSTTTEKILAQKQNCRHHR
ncbi:unnamed protein product [Prunus armeniaca]|uniref:Uncharacterized protein n=1 Tax=Prunus armeniaca TaxID=36596 RepID=A0A6J5UDP5_PRUAR|nr:unnamed protein product [Prunus armeniaca]CAB4304826.1 unnamed protein product [Prunus armeniaca]